MLELTDLSFQAQGRPVLSGVSLTAAPGELVLVTGANGSGKSALGAAATGLLPVWGKVACGGKPLRPRVRRSIGYMPQTAGLYEYLSTAEFLRFYADLVGVPRRQRTKVIQDLLELVGLSDAAGANAGSLSPGQQRRLLLARALVGDPAVLVLDEPLQGLDGAGRQEVAQLLLDLRKMGKALLVLSGDVSQLPYTKLYTLAQGGLTLTEVAEEEPV